MLINSTRYGIEDTALIENILHVYLKVKTISLKPKWWWNANEENKAKIEFNVKLGTLGKINKFMKRWKSNDNSKK
jgi:hypothetical protein